jgi:hypothetical protein
VGPYGTRLHYLFRPASSILSKYYYILSYTERCFKQAAVLLLTVEHRLSSIQIGNSTMKVGNAARAICVQAFRTNTPVTMITTPTPKVLLDSALYCQVLVRIRQSTSRCRGCSQILSRSVLRSSLLINHAISYQVLKRIFKKCDGKLWTGLIWLRIGTGGGIL